MSRKQQLAVEKSFTRRFKFSFAALLKQQSRIVAQAAALLLAEKSVVQSGKRQEGAPFSRGPNRTFFMKANIERSSSGKQFALADAKPNRRYRYAMRHLTKSVYA